eukprot:3893600-Amphidinium_carterae.2
MIQARIAASHALGQALQPLEQRRGKARYSTEGVHYAEDRLDSGRGLSIPMSSCEMLLVEFPTGHYTSRDFIGLEWPLPLPSKP